MTEIECLGTVSMTDGLAVDSPAEHGWVAYNSGPCEWFWSATRERLEHSLTDDLRPATALEKLLLNKQGNQTHDSDAPPPSDLSRADDFLCRLIENAFSWGKQDCNYLNPEHMDRFIEATRNGMPPEAAAAWIADGSTMASRAPKANSDVDAFEKADWFWRTIDPDDSGDSPAEALNTGMVPPYCVCEVGSSYVGPTRFGFNARVLDPESDDEEFIHFATQEEAIAAAEDRRAAVEAMETKENDEA